MFLLLNELLKTIVDVYRLRISSENVFLNRDTGLKKLLMTDPVLDNQQWNVYDKYSVLVYVCCNEALLQHKTYTD